MIGNWNQHLNAWKKLTITKISPHQMEIENLNLNDGKILHITESQEAP
jgi:hypothetical protein